MDLTVTDLTMNLSEYRSIFESNVRLFVQKIKLTNIGSCKEKTMPSALTKSATKWYFQDTVEVQTSVRLKCCSEEPCINECL